MRVPFNANFVDPASPVNWSHPLNRGLIAEYTVLPNVGWSRGSQLFAISRGGLATPTAGTFSGSPTWGGRPRTGGFGGLNCAAQSDYIALADTDSMLPSLSAGTVALWQRKTDSTLRVSAAFCPAAGASSATVDVLLPWSDGNVYFDWGGLSDGSTRLTVTGLSFDTNWHHWVFTVGNGLGMRAYRDGTLVGSNSGTPSRTSNAGVAMRINQYATGAGIPGDLADYDGFQTYNRALTPGEVRGLYLESLAGNPERWNWVRAQRPTVIPVATAYTTSLAGSVTGAGALRRTVSKSLAGSSTTSGATAKQAAKSTTGSSTPTGAETHASAKSMVGATTATGATAATASKAAAGSVAGSGAAAKAISKATAGATTPAGSEAIAAAKAIAGTSTAAGSTANTAAKSATGSAATSGLIAKAASKPTAGSTTPGGLGSFVRSLVASIGGTVAAMGSLVRSIARYLAGLVTGGGSLTTEGGTAAITIARPGGTFKRPPAGRIFARSPAGRVLRRPATVASRIFSRRVGTARVFVRHPATAGRIFKGYPRMAAILITKLPIDTSETRAFIFDFSQFDEAKAGETLDSATIPAVFGVTIGTPAVLTEDTNFIPAGLGVKVNLSVATAGTTYEVECRGVFGGGSTCVVKGQLVGE